MAPKQPPTDEDLRELANWLPVAVLGFVALIYLGLAWQVDLARTSGYGISAGLQSKQGPGVRTERTRFRGERPRLTTAGADI